jgi:beta-glucanase (GH16 family)
MMPTRRPLPFVLLLAALLLTPASPFLASTVLAVPPLIDDFEAPLASGTDPNGIPVGWFTAQDGASTTSFARISAPAPRPGAPDPYSVLQADFTVQSFGVVIHNFESAAADAWVPQDWSSYFGFSFWLYGQNSGTDLFIDLLDNRNAGSTRDDAERYTVTLRDDFSGWRQFEFPFDDFVRKDIGNGAPADGLTLTEVHGWAFGALSTGGPRTFYLDDVTVYGVAPERPLTIGFGSGSVSVREGRTANVSVKLSKVSTDPVTVSFRTADGLATAGRDYLPTSGSITFAPGEREKSFAVTTIDDGKWEPEESVLLFLEGATGAELSVARTARVSIRENDTVDETLIDDFESPVSPVDARRNSTVTTPQIPAGSPLALPGQGDYEGILNVHRNSGLDIHVERLFALGQDWSAAQGVSLWVYGNGTGQPLTVRLYDNRAPDRGPSRWRLAWNDEFNGRAGTLPNPDNWTAEIGDGTINNNPGWGNSELEYYTNDPANASHDGRGRLAITVRKTDPATAPTCYYGPCEYTSARLLTKQKAEFAYGKIEARIKVPAGAGYWPAFWSLGTDIDRVNWPQTGEIDIMEFVGRDPNIVFGTIHGPGYSGGASFGGTYAFTQPVPDAFHTYTVEWQPDRIVWKVDGITYHTATPADIAPDQWVFNHPFFLLLNVAVGGNFGGAVGSNTVFPQSMLVDYVRVYQAADTAERFETTIRDTFVGWKQITLPFSELKRSRFQPDGAPRDGLTLSQVWGYELEAPRGYGRDLRIDQVRLQLNCPATVTVTTAADSGPGSLRQALADVCRGGSVVFAPSLANQTITLTSGELTIARDLTIDGAAAPGLSIGGADAVRVLVVNAQVAATVRNLAIRDGYGFELGGAIIINGQLTLDRVSVSGSRVTVSAGDFWKGGGGIYVGQGATLNLHDSTVRENEVVGADGGGIFGFFESLVVLERSSVIGNTSSNVGAGIRSLGETVVENSTISGNTATGWHGGAIFHTDGTLRLLHATITGNTAPGGTAGGLFVGTFTAAGASFSMRSSIVAGNSGDQCLAGRFGGGQVTLTSEGGNLLADATCASAGAPGDITSPSPQLGALADNGGPTQTHALLPGSPAIDAAPAATCPATDQRGVARPQGAGCDIGAFERGP